MKYAVLAVAMMLGACSPVALGGSAFFAPDLTSLFDTRSEAQKTVAWCEDHQCEPAKKD